MKFFALVLLTTSLTVKLFASPNNKPFPIRSEAGAVRSLWQEPKEIRKNRWIYQNKDVFSEIIIDFDQAKKVESVSATLKSPSDWKEWIEPSAKVLSLPLNSHDVITREEVWAEPKTGKIYEFNKKGQLVKISQQASWTTKKKLQTAAEAFKKALK